MCDKHASKHKLFDANGDAASTNLFDDDFYAAIEAAIDNSKDDDAANAADDDYDGGKPPKDMDKSANMHRMNLERRIRKGDVRPPSQDILNKIDAAIPAGETHAAIMLCNSGWWARRDLRGVIAGEEKDIKKVIKALDERFELIKQQQLAKGG